MVRTLRYYRWMEFVPLQNSVDNSLVAMVLLFYRMLWSVSWSKPRFTAHTRLCRHQGVGKNVNWRLHCVHQWKTKTSQMWHDHWRRRLAGTISLRLPSSLFRLSLRDAVHEKMNVIFIYLYSTKVAVSKGYPTLFASEQALCYIVTRGAVAPTPWMHLQFLYTSIFHHQCH